MGRTRRGGKNIFCSQLGSMAFQRDKSRYAVRVMTVYKFALIRYDNFETKFYLVIV